MIDYAEFCAGIGGFSLGIQQSILEANLVYVNEINESCKKTFVANHQTAINSYDVFDVDSYNLPHFDMMCAGFPCQPFSQAGKGKGFSDPRGTVVFKLFEIIKVVRPSIVFFENVPNLLNIEKGEIYRYIETEFKSMGYIVHKAIIDSTYFGVPQSRPRLYIVAILKNVICDRNFSFTVGTTAKTPLRPFLNNGDYSIPISQRWNEYIDLYTNKKTINEMSFVVPKTRKQLERISPDCDLNDCIFQIRSSGIRAYSLDSPFPTFAVSNSGGGAMIPVLSKERRHINVIEMKRMMGFPDDFIFPDGVSRTDTIKQLANAVCPQVIASICNDLERSLMLNSI